MGSITPALIQESPSMGTIQVQSHQNLSQSQHQQSNQTQLMSSQQINKANEMAQDNSIASEPSTTTTTTSEDVVTTYREPSLKELSTATSNYTIQDKINESNCLKHDINDSDEDKINDSCANKTNENHFINLSTNDDNYSENSDEISVDRNFYVQLPKTSINIEDNTLNGDQMLNLSPKKMHEHQSNQYNVKNDICCVWPVRKVEYSDVYQIVDAIRRNTNVSFNISCEALRVVLTSMEQLFNGSINPYLEAIAVHVTEKVETPKELLGMTHDAKRLQYIFSQLADCKNDTQQRSWMVYEDEDDIIQFLEELVEILVCSANNSEEFESVIYIL